MKLIDGLLAGLCCVGVAALLGAQTLAGEHPSRDGDGQPIRLAQEESGEAAEEAEEGAKEEVKEEEEEIPTSRSAAPQRFIPTEKISADSAVSFPVDI